MRSSTSGFAAVRRRIRRAGPGLVAALPTHTRELALALVTRAADGPTLLPGPVAGPALVLAPHPDDEAIGPGGAIARHVDEGDEVRVVVLTSGGATAGGRADVIARREAESRRAVVHLGLGTEPVFSRLPDGRLAQHMDELTSLITMHGQGVGCVYVPSLLDRHPDHAAAARAVAASGLPDSVVVLGYEVWGPGPVNALLDVTDVFHRKQAALAEYHVALQTVDYVRAASGLAAYRSALGSLGGRGFAEGFMLMTLGEYRAVPT
ncbi:MAG: PIG-L deacetylase family protein [Euzebya sp.]